MRFTEDDAVVSTARNTDMIETQNPQLVIVHKTKSVVITDKRIFHPPSRNTFRCRTDICRTCEADRKQSNDCNSSISKAYAKRRKTTGIQATAI